MQAPDPRIEHMIQEMYAGAKCAFVLVALASALLLVAILIAI